MQQKLKQIIEKNTSLGLDRFPIGFWNYVEIGQFPQHINEEQVADWAQAGFTVPKGPIFNPDDPTQARLMKKVIGWSRERGMKLIVRDPRIFGDRLEEALNEYRGDPAVFGFHVIDEPTHERNDDACRTTSRLRQAAPEFHGYVNLTRYLPGVEEWAGYENRPDYLDKMAREGRLDFFCYDCYEQMNEGTGGWGEWFDNLRLTREACWRNGIPFWVTPVCVGHFHFRCPGFDDLRWQFNTAICSGATGITWYRYYERDPKFNARFAPVDEFWEKTETYYNLRRIHREFHQRYGDLFLKLAPVRVTFYPEAFGNGEVFTPNELLADVKPYIESRKLLIGEFVDIEGRRYVMVVNNSCDENVHVVLTFPDPETKIYSWDWNGREYEGPAYCLYGHERQDNRYIVGYWLAPGQPLVQRVEAKGLRRHPD